ncbi:unnamed protein product [Rotaria magnacalcarata]|uniref:Uncharacterized protein n=1 Tax=Rotaria magnacalcarata TaxID=392030 RepID=A0A819AZI5_9BILA|nr:unnamed protein product [Rotaria magnacalcarata]CAF1376274.1 unnamed protein product [Rotaria magnacalcarata]CAF2046203.1 unnamed protein product [Rotaria magnacalcarata]CAF2100170.1 unnamed protein product [Rotaria magnacalcarata]CAF3793052.1 unnamed protein product [Rotaria magnacalcarata]
MTTSFSFSTPIASLSVGELGIDRNARDKNLLESSNQALFYSLDTSVSRFQQATSSVSLQPTTTSAPNIQYDNNNSKNEQEEHLLSLHYDSNRLKQEKLLLFTNMFRLLIIFIVVPIFYFLV